MSHFKISVLAVLLISGFCDSSVACSFSGSESFTPTLEEWERQPGPKQANEEAEGDYWLPVPVPLVKVDSIGRGTEAPGASCNDAGLLSLHVELPEGSSYSLSDFGVYFRVVSGKDPDAIFPDTPVVGSIVDGKMGFLFAWLDGHPSQQKPVDLEVEAFLVTNDLSIGQSFRFAVKAGVGG